MEQQYDAIVIGSGIGGLTTASILAKLKNKKVLVLEKHWTIGGLTHEFERKRKYSWDVGLHYVGQMDDYDFFPGIMRYITDDKVDWVKMEEPYDIFMYPDHRIEVPNSGRAFNQMLQDRFPEEKEAIKQYFEDMLDLSNWGVKKFMRTFMPGPISGILKMLNNSKRGLAMQTTQEYLDTRFKNDELKAILVSQWGDYGEAPESSCLFAHALVVSHFLKGGFYPKGGSKSIAESIIPVIERAGGKCIVNCEVKEILVENGTAVGCSCEIKKGRKTEQITFKAPIIISNVGAHGTFRKLLKNPMYPELEKDIHLSGASAITLYLGFKDDPRKLKEIKGGNMWIFKSYDHNQMAKNFNPLQDELSFCFASFPSIKDPSNTQHTGELISFSNYKFFKEWKDKNWQERGETYEELKASITKRMLAFMDEQIPGFSDLVEYAELSTPLSIETFTSRAGGMMYGIPVTPERYKLDCLKPKTAIKNLYISGSDVFVLGIAGATLGGVAAACAVLGWSKIISIYRQSMKMLKKP
ncbi:MAG: NAD(P)/FAD-dependent oxidoreductase [Aureispira sp.]|nr:NAD(P)/FAD-dependent oxidoreductase [Aureispira sp.]